MSRLLGLFIRQQEERRYRKKFKKIWKGEWDYDSEKVANKTVLDMPGEIPNSLCPRIKKTWNRQFSRSSWKTQRWIIEPLLEYGKTASCYLVQDFLYEQVSVL
jgi:hypothetical protein